MERYKNLGGDSGISAYEIGSDFIRVEFNNWDLYLYDYIRPGQDEVESMKRLAIEGEGLNAFINKYVRKNYAKKER